MKEKIIKITSENEKEAIEVLTSSIKDDPSKLYYFPDAESRRKHGSWIIDKLSRALGEFNERYAVVKGHKIVAVSMWIPPEKNLSYKLLLKYGLLSLPFRVGIKKFFIIMSSLNIGENLVKEVTKGRPHWHLFYIGVDPKHQRKGYGSLLMKPMLKKANEQNVPVFLQNFTVENTNFYMKNGFQMIKYHDFGNGYLMRNMLHEPE